MKIKIIRETVIKEVTKQPVLKSQPIKEAKLRLRPAIITMNRGTVIRANHARFAKYPSGNKIFVAGINPGRFSRITQSASHIVSQKTPFVLWMRDFYEPYEYVPSPEKNQDENGWAEPNDGYYTTHRQCMYVKKFKKILTMNPNNIKSIQWVNK